MMMIVAEGGSDIQDLRAEQQLTESVWAVYS